MPYQLDTGVIKPDPSIISEQAKSTLRLVLYVGLGSVLGKYVAPETVDTLASSIATVAVSAGGVGLTYLWSLLNKSRLVTAVTAPQVSEQALQLQQTYKR